jgi:multiple sugar transport system substrate-binding protein
MFAAGVPAPSPRTGRSTNLTSPEAIQILSDQAALFADGITSNAIVVDNFASNAVGDADLGQLEQVRLAGGLRRPFADTVGIAPIPTDGPGGTMLYSFLWAVDSTSDAKEESWDLLRFLNEPRDGGLSCTGEMMQGMGAFAGQHGRSRGHHGGRRRVRPGLHRGGDLGARGDAAQHLAGRPRWTASCAATSTRPGPGA